jgi:hypothetical protein
MLQYFKRIASTASLSVRQYKVKAFDSTKKSFLIGLASVNVTEDDVNLTVRVSVYQDPIFNSFSFIILHIVN